MRPLRAASQSPPRPSDASSVRHEAGCGEPAIEMRHRDVARIVERGEQPAAVFSAKRARASRRSISSPFGICETMRPRRCRGRRSRDCAGHSRHGEAAPPHQQGQRQSIAAQHEHMVVGIDPIACVSRRPRPGRAARAGARSAPIASILCGNRPPSLESVSRGGSATGASTSATERSWARGISPPEKAARPEARPDAPRSVPSLLRRHPEAAAAW